MKRKLLILILTLIGFNTFSQNVLDSIHPLFKGDINGDNIRKVYTHYESGKTKNSKIILGLFHSNTLFTKTGLHNIIIPREVDEFRRKTLTDSLSKRNKGYEMRSGIVPVYDSMGVIATAAGISHLNAHLYEFRVLKNRQEEIVSWQPIKLFCESYTLHFNADGTEQTEDAYLGEFKTSFGNSLTIEVRKRTDTLDVHLISALWINRAPKVIATFSNNEMPAFLSVFKQQWKHDFMPIGVGTYYSDIETRPVDSLLVRKTDFKASENSIIFYLDDKVRSKEIIEYNLISGKRQGGWKVNDVDLNLIWLRNLPPGKHKLQLRYSLQRHNISEYVFTIEPAWHQTIIFKIAAVILAIGLIGFIVLLFRSNQQKQELRIAEFKKQQVQTELKSIHSQFNPHFVFNALSSIQALITKNDLQAANKYLSEFSTMLRDSLKNSGKEMVSLFLEIKMLDSYLKLEQLRFGFNYTIGVDEGIDKNAIEIPALLLQPLIENAVKHGIAPLYDKGALAIRFKRSIHDMVVTISDNGTGYDTNKTSAGFGLKLTRERIELLNKMLKDQSIGLAATSTSKGTDVKLLFKNWLS